MSDSKKKLERAELEMREEELESKENPLTYSEFKELDQIKKTLERGEIIINDKRFKCNVCGKPHYIRIQHVYDGDYPDMQNTKIIITEIDKETE
jgi:mRNA-degrading endonuclease HigB of HigAB toxin-antitoxin module